MIYLIQISYRDPRPIYEQVKDGFRTLIVTGAMCPDERMPSVRELATLLAINPNTIQRAYRELEQEAERDQRRTEETRRGRKHHDRVDQRGNGT